MPQIIRTVAALGLSAGVALAGPLLGSRTDFAASGFCRTYQCQRIAQDVIGADFIEDRYRLNAVDASRELLPVIVVYSQRNRLEGISFEHGGADVWAWLGDGDSPNAMLRELVKDVTGASLTASALMGFGQRCQVSGTRVTLSVAQAKLSCLRYLGEFRAGWRSVIRLRR